MAAFGAGDIVAIVRLNAKAHGCLGRHPQPGETGRVRHVIEENGYLTYIVERLHPDGTEDWLCDFDEADLELKSRPE
jgi:hypothetical protein